jgi:hypothetical protein
MASGLDSLSTTSSNHPPFGPWVVQAGDRDGACAARDGCEAAARLERATHASRPLFRMSGILVSRLGSIDPTTPRVGEEGGGKLSVPRAFRREELEDSQAHRLGCASC